MKKLMFLIYLFSEFEDFQSRWLFFCEYVMNPEKLEERYNLERHIYEMRHQSC